MNKDLKSLMNSPEWKKFKEECKIFDQVLRKTSFIDLTNQYFQVHTGFDIEILPIQFQTAIETIDGFMELYHEEMARIEPLDNTGL